MHKRDIIYVSLSNERVIMEETTARNTTIGSAQLKAPKESELDRLFNQIGQQSELISMLDNRLDPVMHRTPEADKEPGRDTRPHISEAVDLVSRNNRKLAQILEQIAL